jgi:hypothetical protein
LPNPEELWRPAKLKIDRARSHVSELSVKVEDYISRRPLRLALTKKKGISERILRIETRENVPEEFSLISGDAVHNLRASLDIAIFTIIGSLSKKPTEVQFPVTWGAGGLSAAIEKRQISLGGEALVNFFENLKPYPGGDKYISHLNTLDIADKHKLIIATACFPYFTLGEIYAIDPQMGGFRNDPRRIILIPSDDLLYKYEPKNYNRIDKLTRLEEFDFEPHINPGIRVTFGRDLPFEGEDMVSTLIEVADHFEIVIKNMISVYLNPVL